MLLAMAMLFSAPLFSQDKPCGSFVDPVAALEHEQRIADDLAAFTKAYLKDGAFRKSKITVVPIQIHIVQLNDGTGGVAYQTVLDELEIVNDRYAPDLQFAECGDVNYINSTAYYTLSSFGEGHDMSFDHNEPEVLNMYFVGDANGYCGWANFSTSLPRDYIVVDNACASNTSTLAHEIGHYFDLYHTHHTSFGDECVDGSNCTTAGDRLCDTPADPNVSGDVNGDCEYTGGEVDVCNFEPYNPDPTNIMSYSRKACRDYFSPQQRAKVLFTVENNRSYLRYDCSPPSIINSAMFCGLELEIPDNRCGADALEAVVMVQGEQAIHLGQDVFLRNVDLIIDHPNNRDLEISLVSPAGVEVLLSSNNGGSGNDYGSPNNCNNTVCAFSMDAADSISSLSNQHINIIGEYIPEGDLNDFHDGSDPNGEWTLRICDGKADFTGTLEYIFLNFEVLPPFNDDVCNAKTVDVGEAFHVIGTLATSEGNEINPGPGGPDYSCQEQNGWCEIAPEPNADNTTWFTFIAPPGGQVDVSMDNDDDAQFALWSVGDCGDFDSFVEIAANDDGPFSFAPYIEGACVVPGEVYYLQVDGFDGEGYDTYITISDVGTPISLTCPPDQTVSCEGGIDPSVIGQAMHSVNLCCSNLLDFTYVDDTLAFNCQNNYTFARTWTADYDCGLTTTCEQVITVEDLIVPSITCPDDASVSCDEDVSPANTGMAMGTDNCSSLDIVSADEIMDGNCPNDYSIMRKWTGTDECGQQVTCEQMIAVSDTSLPTINCPDDKTVSCENDASPDNTGMAVATDNCYMTITSDDVIANGSCPSEYTITRTWSVTDECHAAVFCEQLILVNDTTPPGITCPDDRTVACEEDLNSINMGMATTDDNCSTATVISNDIIVNGNCPSEYTVARTWTATDECGNQITCEQMIQVEDTTAPSITCPTNVTIACGEDASPANTGMATGTDNCGVVTFISDDMMVAGSCPSNNVISRTWTVTDECGRQSTCEQTVQIEDTTPPTMTCTDAVTVTPSANGSYGFSQMEIDALGAGSADDCGAVSFSISQSHFTCAEEGLQAIMLTGTDDCGNSSSCEISVTINPFMQLINSTVTNESCAGASDGEIYLEATALGGEVHYSIDGGDNFFVDGHFTNLTSGMYDMVIKVEGITEVCEITGTKEVSADIPGLTWFEDADGDGFHSGNSLQSCDSIPGYSTVAMSGDCDDSNALVFPGAAEICDGLDNNCDGQTPVAELDTDSDGHRPCDGDCDDTNATVFPNAPELCDGLDNDCDANIPAEETDADADGHRLCDNDCNDNDAAVYPNAPEVCDGKDNDCNNETDEGPPETYFGDVTFNNQSELDAWLPCFHIIDGNVTIIGTDIDTLGPLSNIIEITGSLTIHTNDLLQTLNGLENLLTVGDSLAIYLNSNLMNCCAIDSLLEIGGVQNATVINSNNPDSYCNSESGILDNCPFFSSTDDLSDLQNPPLLLFPNPTTGEVTAVFKRTKKGASLQIRDVLGRLVFSEKLAAGTERSVIHLREEGLSDGVYFVSVLDDGMLVSGELVVVGE